MKLNCISAHAAVALGVLVTAGCQQPVTTTQDNGVAELRLLGQMYGEYLAQRGGELPADEEKLKAYISIRKGWLEDIGVDSIDNLFISPRDSEPLVVFYADQPGPEGPGGFPWAAYERTGQAGKRFAVSARGSLEEMDSARFNQVF